MEEATDREREAAVQAGDTLVERMLSPAIATEERIMILLSFFDFFAPLPDVQAYPGMEWVEEWGGQLLRDPAFAPEETPLIKRIVELARARIAEIVGGSTIPS